MTKAAMDRFLKSEFYYRTCEVVQAWDFYLRSKNEQSADECEHEWRMAKVALEHVTGKTYGISRTDEGFAIVNKSDLSDVLFSREIFCFTDFGQPIYRE